MSYFTDALSAGYDAIEDVAGEDVVYNDLTGTFTAWMVPEGKDEQDTEVGGNRIRSITRAVSFLVRPALMVRDNVAVLPAQKHTITRDGNRVYRVQNPSGDPVWEWSDANRTHYRIFTVEV